MRFLLRMAFWLGVIAILLPRGASQPESSAQISATDAMSAATATVGDMRQFCERQPEACTVGSQAAVAIEDRAKAGAKRLYEMFNERLSVNDNDRIITATAKSPKSVPLPPARPSQHAPQIRNAPQSTSEPPAQAASQNTLTPADLAPAWRGPPSRKEQREQPA
jgi:Family of unknown function (DUF5330)